MPDVLLLFDHFGPYHRARLNGALKVGMPVAGVEFYSRSRDYCWAPSEGMELPVKTVCTGINMTKAEFRLALVAMLESLQPKAVAVPGWASFEALTALDWCVARKVPAIMMTESCSHDEVRRGWKEALKRMILGCCSSALAGGSLHQEYLKELGFRENQIFLGYDAVDNVYFSERTNLARLKTDCKSAGVFLASARFIEKKNLSRLVSAYGQYRLSVAEGKSPWPLMLLGDGQLRPALETQIAELGLQDFVSMPGFVQYEQLPSYYARASAFIHASTTEQWGLVVNEAMASGLPVIVSDRCGCAADLVQEGVNGFTFDPYDVEALSMTMARMSALPAADREAMGLASRKIVSDWGPDRFGRGLLEAARWSVKSLHNPGWLNRLVVKSLARL